MVNMKKPPVYHYEYNLDDENETPITVEYVFHKGCCDYFSWGCWNPGEPDEIEIYRIFDKNGKDIKVTPDFEKKITQLIHENYEPNQLEE